MIVGFTQRWRDIEPLIDQLFDVPASQRDAWLRRHCDDATLRDMVMRVLAHAPAITALERGVGQWLPELTDETADALPDITGYRVLRFVGAGGMASVFAAERALPGGPQAVALKLLRIDVHDADERRRFLREQRILARLQHPRIAQLLDAGFSPTGTPFLALEFVDGTDLLSHCAQRELGTRERLALFLDVCAAVEYAHRNLIVHRDIKPSNVLVDDDGGVKLVDFGIAKLLTGDGERTRTEARRLTRSYAAPEQFAGDTATTAIDVYALGMLLAGLLGGALPPRADNDGADTFDEDALRKQLGVDLHAIVRQATRVDPQRRYAGVAALADDISHYLDGRPLQARADTFAYRLFTHARRHRWTVAAAIVAALLLSGATIAGLHEAQLARIAAEQARAQALAAEGEARRADALKVFLEGLFDSASPGRQGDAAAEALLAQGRERADRDFAMQPALRIEIIALIGDLERRSGHPALALKPLEEAGTLATTQWGATDRRTLHIEYLLAKEFDELGRVREATTRLAHAIAAFDHGGDRGSPDEVLALAWLAGLDERIGESSQAVALGTKAVALARRALPADSDALTEAVTNLGWIQMDAGHPARAEPLLREALSRKRHHFGDRHADVADAMTFLTSALLQLGRYDEGERLMREALAIDATLYAQPNAHMAWHTNDFAHVLALEGRLEEARGVFARAVAIDQGLAPAADLTEAVSIGNVARVRLRQGDAVAAEAGMRDAIARKQRVLGDDYDDNGRSYDLASLAEILVAQGKTGDAQSLADQALAQARRRHGEAHPDTAFALMVQAEVAVAAGLRERAVTFARESAEMHAALEDDASDKAIRARLLFGETLHAAGRDADAQAPLHAALAAARAITPAAGALIAHAQADLGSVDSALGDVAGANQLRAGLTATLAGLGHGPDRERDDAQRWLAAGNSAPH